MKYRRKRRYRVPALLIILGVLVGLGAVDLANFAKRSCAVRGKDNTPDFLSGCFVGGRFPRAVVML
jgi:hypothetical protein